MGWGRRPVSAIPAVTDGQPQILWERAGGGWGFLADCFLHMCDDIRVVSININRAQYRITEVEYECSPGSFQNLTKTTGYPGEC